MESVRYQDIPSEALQVEFNGRKIMINALFLDVRKCWDNLESIREKFMWRLIIFDEMSLTKDRKELKEWFKLYTKNEFEIQKNFKLKKDARFHRFWDVPNCSCPKMDNEDLWGMEFSIYRKNCLVHGE